MLARRTSSSIAPPCVAAGGPLPQGCIGFPRSLVPTLRVGMPPATLRVASAVGRSARRGWQSTVTAEAAGQAGLGAPTFGPGREEQGLDYCRGKSQNLTPSPSSGSSTMLKPLVVTRKTASNQASRAGRHAAVRG